MPLQFGTRLGPYEVQSALGKGGMGEVYRARDLRLQRDVAVKVLPTQFKPGSLSLAQFEREAHLLASLNHPNICSIYDVGTEGGTSFIVMEHLQGETLAARIERSPISVNVALVYAIQIVEALAVAHSAGLVHRDIKPGNIMLTTTGVKLLDFGLAKRHMAGAAPASRGDVETAQADGTDREGIVGTLHYMAPEQLAGAGVDARSDIWAFGCVVYEMVTGRRAFSGRTLTDVIAAIVSDRPVVMTTDRGVIPLALQHLVARCLARNPLERWQTATDVARELRSMLPPQPGSGPVDVDPVRAPVKDSGALSQTAVPVAVTPNETPQSRTRQGLWIATAVTVIALAAGAGWFLFGRGTAAAPPDSVAVLPFVSVGGSSRIEYLTEGLADGLATELARRPHIRVIPSSTALHYVSAPDPRSAGQSLGVVRVVTGRVTMRGGRIDVDTEVVDVAKGTASWSGHYSEAESDLLPLTRELARGILVALGLEPASQDPVLETMPLQLSSDVYRLILRGRFALSRGDESSLKNAIALFSEATKKDPRAAAAFAGLADAHNAMVQAAAMRPNEMFPKSKIAATRALELDSSLANAHTALGVVKMFYDRDWKAAGAAYERAVTLRPDDPAAHVARAEWLMNLGRSEEALIESRTATRLDPLSVAASLNLGWQLFLARQYSDAVDQLKATITLDSNSAAAHWALGAAYEKSGRLEDAVRELQSVITMSEGKSLYLSELGYAYGRASRLVEARHVLDRLRSIAERGYVSSFDMGLVAVGLNDRDTAFKWLAQAVDEHAPGVATLGVDPRLDDLRTDPRFKDLLKRVGIS